jgi:Aspartyl protease
VPAPVVGAMLLDTGATTTCISSAAAAALGVVPTRITESFGSGGRTEHQMFFVALHIQIGGPGGVMTTISMEGERAAIKDLDLPFKGRPPIYAGAPIEVIGLLGRDVLSFTRVTYDGVAGAVSVSFDHVRLNQAAATKPIVGTDPIQKE